MNATESPRRNEQGLALVSVLWVVLLLSIVAASMVGSTRTNGALASATYDRARSEAIAEAGTASTIVRLMDPRAQPQLDGTSYQFAFGDATISIAIRDETGKIDLNTASDDLLRSLLKSVGISDDAAGGLFDKIADWRDEDDLRRLSGAEADDYRERGYPYGPKNGPFDSIDELKEVMDMTPDTFNQIKQIVTVYSSRDSIDPLAAQPGALQALSQMMSGQTEALLSEHQKSDLASGVAAPSVLSGPVTGKAFTIRAEVSLENRSALAMETVVRLTADPRRPYWILRSKMAMLE